MQTELTALNVSYDDSDETGIFEIHDSQILLGIWSRIMSHIIARKIEAKIDSGKISMPWPEALGIIREFGTKQIQRTYRFRFHPNTEAKEKINQFVAELKMVNSARNRLRKAVTSDDITSQLKSLGFTRRELRPFQLRDLQVLLSLPNGANFSVPGAGKTTVTFALHLLARVNGQHLLVVAPKSAFIAWEEVVSECLGDTASPELAEPFTVLDGNEAQSEHQLLSGATRFIISYDLLIRQQGVISSYLARRPVHVVLDESHRMKAGWGSQRGAFLLNVATLPIRRDILSGTPMPQGANDLASQLGFLWPGHGFDIEIARGASPREVLKNIYVRTTKQELGLPETRRHFYDVDMAAGQLALYSIVRSEALLRLTASIRVKGMDPDFMSARRSVMRLLQLSVDPLLALSAMANDDVTVRSAIVDQVIEEGTSSKFQAVISKARELAAHGKKVVIWTIFTGSIKVLENALADLDPVTIYGAIPCGSASDLSTREGRLRKFHKDRNCFALIANPAAAGEGISLHTVCHEAIYVDRSYVSTHYLQSIDRIHRLGLAPDTETNIHIYRTRAPAEIGSIDLSVSRRLATKIRNMQLLLNDPDLHQLALDEENAVDPINYDVDLQDMIDLVAELENKQNEDSLDKA